MSTATAVLVLVTAVAAGANGGVFFAFSSFVMPGLARLPDDQGLAAMQSINVTAVRAPFMVLFLGTVALCIAVAVVALRALGEPGAPWLLAGAALYLGGCFVLTIAFHVPRNDALATTQGAGAWRTYLSAWTAGNHVRAAAGLLSAAALVQALRV